MLKSPLMKFTPLGSAVHVVRWKMLPTKQRQQNNSLHYFPLVIINSFGENLSDLVDQNTLVFTFNR